MALHPPTSAEFAAYRAAHPEAGVDQTFWALVTVDGGSIDLSDLPTTPQAAGVLWNNGGMIAMGPL